MATIVTSLLLNLAILFSGNAPQDAKQKDKTTVNPTTKSTLGGSSTWSDVD